MSVESFVPQKEVVSLTPTAMKHFESKLASAPGKIIRLSTKESGCTGFAYVVDFADKAEADDTVVTVSDTITLAVANASLPILKHTELDYVKEGINGVLKFNNPNVVDACGCGESFSVGQ
ncbi:iron-sulfur cluster assembly accessory protein [Aliidiomarina taiwanensis]|uniref:Iron-sulfur cluster assembly accessory protein n=1 Tax=Aliidiomarina taiwanensis TaxID=946228 RepID=A0A432XA45_9GAMM|nr:iron-sulfur cluster assembly accessory protein [Aliidiomarina taiwanensis]RUO44257.1 iron-sulfur cluster assembly accessory protein [Aliidiomarina taiwanensis]